MRVLLVTWTDQLLQKLSILSPELEYCAIVVDEVEPAKKILERVGLSPNLIHPLYDLKECVKDFYYDCVMCVENRESEALLTKVKSYGVLQDKILTFYALNSWDNFLLERSLRYFKEHAAEFEMFATGISYVEKCLDVTRFKRKLFNFGRGSQDLYYNFQVSKRAALYGGGHKRIRYALIGLAAYVFHYDQSKSLNHLRLWQYLTALGDLHNFHMSVEVCKKFFREEYLSTKIPLEPFNVNNPYLAKPPMSFMTPQSRLEVRNSAELWTEKNYPETRDENVKILDEYLTLCEDNNIRPIMFLPPSTEGYKKHFGKKKLDEFYYLVGQACRKHSSAIFIDGWKLQGVTDADFYDYGHMNIQGAAKFSSFLNDFIERLDG